jgi:hypothetical protein
VSDHRARSQRISEIFVLNPEAPILKGKRSKEQQKVEDPRRYLMEEPF